MEKKVEFKDKILNLIAIIFFLLSIFWHPQNVIIKTIMGIVWIIFIAYYLVLTIRWMRKRKTDSLRK